MEAKKALLKLREKYYYLDQYICFEVVEADAGLFFIHPGEGKLILASGVDIDKDLLKSVKSENGLPVEIKAFNALDEEIDLFLPDKKESEKNGKREQMFLFRQSGCVSGKFYLEAIDDRGEIIPIFPKLISADVDSALELVRDCEGVLSAELSDDCLVLEIDERVSQMKMLRDIENWLGSSLSAKLIILTINEYASIFCDVDSILQCPPNQRKLDFS